MSATVPAGSAQARRPAASLRHALRAATAAEHDRVDAAFGRFALDDPAGYAAFLRAHARALVPIEAAVAEAELLPDWSPRAPLLLADLAELGEPTPVTDAAEPPRSEAARWGMLYVIEGSRLGGAMLAKSVPASLPRRYLGASHRDGSWQRFDLALEKAAGDAAWRAEAEAGAHHAFARFAAAAEAEGARG